MSAVLAEELRKKRPAYWVSGVRPWKSCDHETQEALRVAWAEGDLSYKLSPQQRIVYDQCRGWSISKSRQGRLFAFDCSRRFGKSSVFITIAFEDAIRRPGARVVYYGPKHKDLMKFIREHISKVLQDCPPELEPEWVKSESMFRFPNGSVIEFIGLDVNPDGARGGAFDTCILDECGFFTNLEGIVQSVLFPQMMGRAHARIYAGSTPPESPSHWWSAVMIPKAIYEEAYAHRTVLDADIYTDDEVAEFIAELGGIKATRCRRELFCEHVTDESLAIIPEFREAEAACVTAVDPPRWRDCYESLDPGWNDLTFVCFGYWHFELRKLVVEDEVAAPRMNSKVIADKIKDKEASLWGKVFRRNHDGTGLLPQPYMRVSDNDLRLINDLATEHQLVFAATQKDNLEQQINAVRVAFTSESILIHPRCRILISHLKNGVWKNEARKVFAREGGDMGHFDGIAALVYLWRNVHRYRNPQPRVMRLYAGDLPNDKAPSNQQGASAKSKWGARKNRLFYRGK